MWSQIVTISQNQLKNKIYLIRIGHTKALTFFKVTFVGHFPCPAETDPYMCSWKAYPLMISFEVFWMQWENNWVIYSWGEGGLAGTVSLTEGGFNHSPR